MHARRPWEPPELYSWTIVAPDGELPERGALGITDHERRALAAVSAALRAAPEGSRGLIHQVTLSFSRAAYLYVALVARGRYDPISNAVVWDEIPPRSSWAQLNAMVAEALDHLPPEAISAGLADAETHQEHPGLQPGAGVARGRGM